MRSKLLEPRIDQDGLRHCPECGEVMYLAVKGEQVLEGQPAPTEDSYLCLQGHGAAPYRQKNGELGEK